MELFEYKESGKNEQLETNYFSESYLLKLYGQFVNLDRNKSGTLDKEELRVYGGGIISDLVLERLFEGMFEKSFHRCRIY